MFFRGMLDRWFGRALAFVVAALALCSCSGESERNPLMDLPLEQQVAQLFIVRPEQVTPSDTLVLGGFCIFGNHIESADSLRGLIARLRGMEQPGIPMFVCVDEEGGRVSRLVREAGVVEGVEFVPSAAQMAHDGTTLETASVISSYLRDFGFNVDFAPVVDVNSNPDNTVIGDRAFSSSPEVVAAEAAKYLTGLHANGIMGSIKHFPGHGDVTGDTHKSFVATSKSLPELMDCELVPYKANLSETDMVMVSHITVPAISEHPASISPEIVSILRDTLGYQGLAITDGMGMGAIQNYYGIGESAVMALKAGVDIVLLPANLHEAYEAVLMAVLSGEISQQRLEESLDRIWNLKKKL